MSLIYTFARSNPNNPALDSCLVESSEDRLHKRFIRILYVSQEYTTYIFYVMECKNVYVV